MAWVLRKKSLRRKRKPFNPGGKWEPPVEGWEWSEQCRLFRWLETLDHPAVALTFAVPNDALFTPEMWQHFSLSGAKAGVSDIVSLYPGANGSHGLVIEMKAGRGELRPNQAKFLTLAARAGYDAYACWGFDEAQGSFLDHLGL